MKPCKWNGSTQHWKDDKNKPRFPTGYTRTSKWGQTAPKSHLAITALLCGCRIVWKCAGIALSTEKLSAQFPHKSLGCLGWWRRQASVNVAWLTTLSSLCQCCLANKPLLMLPGRQASVSVAWPTSCQAPAKVALPTGCCGTSGAPSLRHENMTAENRSQIPKTSLQHSTVVGFCQLSLPPPPPSLSPSKKGLISDHLRKILIPTTFMNSTGSLPAGLASCQKHCLRGSGGSLVSTGIWW